MLVIPSAALALLVVITIPVTPAHSAVAVPLVSANQFCTSEQTQCSLGCCPYPDGVCCADGSECCQHGQVCIPQVGICIGLVNEEKKDLALVSSKATPLEMPCPSSFTTCGPDKCCIFTDATCCSDGEYCCPNGYRCDFTNKRCMKNSDKNYSTLDAYETSNKKEFELFQGVRKRILRACPTRRGRRILCPSGMTCCLNDKGEWGCCPKPTSLQYQKKGSNMCCDTMQGYICCPAWAQACTYIGCI